MAIPPGNTSEELRRMRAELDALKAERNRAAKGPKTFKENIKTSLDIDDNELKSMSSQISSSFKKNSDIMLQYGISLDSLSQIMKTASLQANNISKARAMFGAKIQMDLVQEIQNSSAKSYGELENKYKDQKAIEKEIQGRFKEAGYKMNTAVKDMISDLSKTVSEKSKVAFTTGNLGEAKKETFAQDLAQIEKVKDGWKSFKNNILGDFAALKDTMKSPQLALIGFLGGLADKVVGFGKAILEVRKELGLSVSQTWEATKVIGEAQARTLRWAASSKEVADAYIALSQVTGDLSLANADAVTSVTKLAKLSGVPAPELAKAQVVLKTMSGSSDAMADSLLVGALNIARMTKIAPQHMMKLVADHAEQFARVGAEGAKNLLKTLAITTKLGVEFQKLVGMGDSLLDVEGLLGKQMEYNATFGRNMDLTSAAALYNQKDYLGFTKELVKELNTIPGGFENLTTMEQNKLAELIGGGLTGVDIARLIKNKDIVLGAGTDLISISNAMTTAMANPNVEKAKGESIFNWLSDPKSILMVLFGLQALKGLVGGIGFLGTKMVWLGKITSWLGITSKAAGPGINASKAAMTGFGVSGMGLIKGAAAIAILAGSLFIFGKALQEFKGIGLNEMTVAAGGMLILAGGLYALGTMVSTPQGAAALLIGAAAMVIMSGALWIFGKALQEVAKSLPIFATGLSQLSILGAGIFTVASGLWALGMSLTPLALISVGLLPLGIAFQMMGAGLNAMTPALLQLVAIKSSLSSIGLGFASLGAGLIPLATGLALMTPLIPILYAVSKIGGIAFPSKVETISQPILSPISTKAEPVPAGISTINPKESVQTTSIEKNKSGLEKKTEPENNNFQLSIDALSQQVSEISDMIAQGAAINIDGRKIGYWLGKHNSSVSFLENRG